MPVWHAGLTKNKPADIESIQKTAMEIILQENYSGYDLACNIFSTQTIKTRRTKQKYEKWPFFLQQNWHNCENQAQKWHCEGIQV